MRLRGRAYGRVHPRPAPSRVVQKEERGRDPGMVCTPPPACAGCAPRGSTEGEAATGRPFCRLRVGG
eukprot:scaffold3378_cov93-Isochrysis_galbana.AAC.7